MNVLLIVALIVLCCNSAAFKAPRVSREVRSRGQLGMSIGSNFMTGVSQLLADTSIGEEDVLSIQGTTSDLPDPIYAVAIAVVIGGRSVYLYFWRLRKHNTSTAR